MLAGKLAKKHNLAAKPSMDLDMVHWAEIKQDFTPALNLPKINITIQYHPDQQTSCVLGILAFSMVCMARIVCNFLYSTKQWDVNIV